MGTMRFLSSNEDKIRNGSYVQNLLGAVLLPLAVASKVPGYSRLDSLEVKGPHLADISI